MKGIVSVLLTFMLGSSLNIDDFGAKPDDSSYAASVINGEAFNSAILAANAGIEKTVVISSGKSYFMLPAGDIFNIINVTVQIDGIINAWPGAESQWPTNSDGGVLSLISFVNTQGLIITGTGEVNGNGYNWW